MPETLNPAMQANFASWLQTEYGMAPGSSAAFAADPSGPTYAQAHAGWIAAPYSPTIVEPSAAAAAPQSTIKSTLEGLLPWNWGGDDSLPPVTNIPGRYDPGPMPAEFQNPLGGFTEMLNEPLGYRSNGLRPIPTRRAPAWYEPGGSGIPLSTGGVDPSTGLPVGSVEHANALTAGLPGIGRTTATVPENDPLNFGQEEWPRPPQRTTSSEPWINPYEVYQEPGVDMGTAGRMQRRWLRQEEEISSGHYGGHRRGNITDPAMRRLRISQLALREQMRRQGVLFYPSPGINGTGMMYDPNGQLTRAPGNYNQFPGVAARLNNAFGGAINSVNPAHTLEGGLGGAAMALNPSPIGPGIGFFRGLIRDPYANGNESYFPNTWARVIGTALHAGNLYYNWPGPDSGSNNPLPPPPCILNCCFVAGTKIAMSDGSTKNIEHIKVDDNILSYNIDNNTVEPDIVKSLTKTLRSDIINITFETGDVNRNAADHPYYVVGKGWSSYDPDLTEEFHTLSVDRLEIGDICYKIIDGEVSKVRISNMIEEVGEVDTFNLHKVEYNSNYFANGYLVHNKDGGF